MHLCQEEINAAALSVPVVGVAFRWLRIKLGRRKQPTVIYNGIHVTPATDPRIR